MKKTIIGLVAMAGLICAGQASAITLENTILNYPSGPVSFKFSGYTQTNEAGTSGAFSITNLFESVTAGAQGELAAWAPSANDYVYAVLGGFTDIQAPNANTIWSKGGVFSLYETTTAYDLTQGPGVMATIPVGAKKLLEGFFIPSTKDGTATLIQSYVTNGNNGGFSGSGNAYASLIGGSLFSRLDTNSQMNGSDLSFSFNYKHEGENAKNWGPNGVFITDPAIGATSPVPEPATMLLFGTGLIGLAGVGRKLRK